MKIIDPVTVTCTIPEALLADLRVMIVTYGGKIDSALKNDDVSITCYGKTEKMKRLDAIKTYEECAACSEGSEHERYERILDDLRAGKTNCSDE